MKKEDVFLNILILFNPYTPHKWVTGSSPKGISLMSQFIYFYKSIKKNLKSIKYQISIVHADNFNKRDMNILSNLDVDLLKIDNIKKSWNYLGAIAINRYIVNTKHRGTHRLIAETDMLLLKEPMFNWNVDFQANYAFHNKSLKKIIEYSYKKYNLNKLDENINWKINPFIAYNINNYDYKKIPPSFNNGLILVKEDFSTKLYNNYLFPIKESETVNPIWKNFGMQMMMGPILLTASKNWEPFNPGINFLALFHNKFEKNKISLLHYCGRNADLIAKKLFPNYFNIRML